MESMKATGMKGSFCFVFLLFKDNAKCFFPFLFLCGKVETCGDP